MEGDDVDEGGANVGRITPKSHREEDENRSTGEAADLQKISWSYSQYMDALEREDVISKTNEDTFSCLSGECELPISKVVFLFEPIHLRLI